MIRGAKAFARLGLAAGAVAILLAATVTGSVAEQKTALAAAFLLALCEVAAALVAAGPEERKRRPLAWVRVGLFAALASFIAIFALAIPTVFATVMTGAGGNLIVAMTVWGLAVLFGGWVIMRTHEIVWRRFAPKDSGP